MKINKLVWILILLVVWQAVTVSGIVSPLIFPSLGMIFKAMVSSIMAGELLQQTVFSIIIIFEGLIIGALLALIFAIASRTSETLNSLVETLITLAHPLPGIALLPIIILWLGTGRSSIIFIIVHSVLWPLLLNLITGFKTTPKVYSDVGRNIGLKGLMLFKDIYIPASLPYLLSGFKIAWARAWRALISAEMVFGAVGGKGGLGWYIFKQRVFMDTAGMFAALFLIMLIGILVEEVFFNKVEALTIRRWGMTEK
ncbi:MAG: ABC transporter permease subunit [Lutisporaceae bacterium]